jgi:hypothetical protein
LKEEEYRYTTQMPSVYSPSFLHFPPETADGEGRANDIDFSLMEVIMYTAYFIQ